MDGSRSGCGALAADAWPARYRWIAHGAAGISRRLCLAGGAALSLGGAASVPAIRVGLLQFGTVQWIADVIRRHGLDTAHGVALQPVVLANGDAGRIALMAGGADIVISDLFFAASAWSRGTKLRFAPLSSAAGGIMVRGISPIRSLADLHGRHLGVAGGPLDKSWVLMQAAAQRQGIALATAAMVNYAAPPLLEAKLLQGELDAVLTYWNFVARLRAQGAREIASVASSERALGIPPATAMVGFVFHDAWAQAHRRAVDGFLAAVHDAEALLTRSDDEWRLIRPLMRAPGDALFAELRAHFLGGIVPPGTGAAQERAARRLVRVLAQAGGARAAGGITALPAGLYWQGDHAT